VTCEEDNLRGGRDSSYLNGCLDAVHHGHANVKKNQIRLQLTDLFNSFLSILGFTAYVERVAVDEPPDSASRYRMVIHDKDAGHFPQAGYGR
jgi:hypothetical protein